MSALENAEPTMEEILASIRKIISDEQAPESPAAALSAVAPVLAASREEPHADWDDVEELIVDDAADPEPVRPQIKASTDILELTDLAERMQRQSGRAPSGRVSERLISEQTEEQAAQKLSALSGMMVRDYPGAENTLDALVRDMLKPLMKEWLDAHLPEIVDRIVAREIQRISGSNRN